MALISEIEVKDRVYLLLSSSEAAEAITGRIYKDDKRPANSTLEDVEISVIASTARQNQSFTVNVNVFVRDIRRDENDTVANDARLRELCSVFMRVLEYSASEGWILSLDSQRVMKVNGTDLHVINNRLNIMYNSEN